MTEEMQTVGTDSEIVPRTKSCNLFSRKQEARRLRRSGDERGLQTEDDDISAALPIGGFN